MTVSLNTKIMLKICSTKELKLFALTMDLSIVIINSTRFVKVMVLYIKNRAFTHHNKTVFLNDITERLWNVHDVYCLIRVCLAIFGLKQ